MKIITANNFPDYSLIDSGNSKRLERFGKFLISKPDPQAIWNPSLSDLEWNNTDAVFTTDKWVNNMPDIWEMAYKDIKFFAKLTPFKHTGVFPEQSANWEFMENIIKNSKKQLNVLNLFGYTGIASLVCVNKGAKVTHVDGSKPSIAWAKENQELSGLSDKPIRWILDDALEFTAREARRSNVYDAIIMDPPVYGHGPNGETWDFNKSFPQLLRNCRQILAKEPAFVIVNAYAISASSLMLRNTMEDYLKLDKEKIEYGELVLEEEKRGRLLSTGIFARFST